MKIIGVFEAKTHLSQILNDVEDNEEYIIQKRGKNVALIQSFNNVENKKHKKDAEVILSAFREIRESQSDMKNVKTSVKDLVGSGRKY